MIVLLIHHLASQNYHLEQAFQAWTTKPFGIISYNSTKRWDLVQHNVNFPLQNGITIFTDSWLLQFHRFTFLGQ
jgi:hypothetical protein